MPKQLTVGSLFSGIGGLDLGLERAGMKVIWQSEIDPYANRVLAKHWPGTPNYGNIKEIDWDEIERPNIICGGYPCQPFSQAGKRRGEKDPRHLWPWVREAISQLQPDYAILENVRGHLTLGGTTVLGELATIGYDAEWRVVSAASVGANHRRDRIIIVAHPNDAGSHRSPVFPAETGVNALGWIGRRGADVADTNGERLERQRAQQQTAGLARSGQNEGKSVADTDCEQLGKRRLAQNAGQTGGSRVYHGKRQEGYDGWQWWQTEPNVGRVANGVPSRVDRLRGLGNAVVPQVAEIIGLLVKNHWENRHGI